MLIVLLDEPGLFVFDSVAEAVESIEPIDAEDWIRAAYDEAGVPYRVEWLQPNRKGRKIFGAIMVKQGEYTLVPAGPALPEELAALIEQHPEFTNPPEAQATLQALLPKLRAT